MYAKFCLLLSLFAFAAQPALAGIFEDVENGREDKVVQYLKKGGNPDVPRDEEYDSSTPLCAALEKKQLRIANILLDAGASANAYCGPASPMELPVLGAAIDTGDADITMKIISKGAKLDDYLNDDPKQPYFSALAYAIEETRTSPKVIDLIIERGGNVNGNLCLSDDMGTTPLRAAAQMGRYDLFMRLISLGAKLTQTAPYDGIHHNTVENRMLGCAISGGNRQIIDYCLNHGMKLTKKNMTVIMHKYVGMYSLEMLKYMEQQGLDIHADLDGSSFLDGFLWKVEELNKELNSKEFCESAPVRRAQYALDKGVTYRQAYNGIVQKIRACRKQ